MDGWIINLAGKSNCKNIYRISINIVNPPAA